jgi:hypothetical protein
VTRGVVFIEIMFLAVLHEVSHMCIDGMVMMDGGLRDLTLNISLIPTWVYAYSTHH